MELLSDICRYRTLKVRHTFLRHWLDDGDQAVLARLERRFEFPREPATPVGRDHPPRRFFRYYVHLEATFEHGKALTPVVVLDVGGGGLSVAPDPGLERGDVGVVLVANHQRTYRFPVQVVRRMASPAGPAIGCALIGLPEEGALRAAG